MSAYKAGISSETGPINQYRAPLLFHQLSYCFCSAIKALVQRPAKLSEARTRHGMAEKSLRLFDATAALPAHYWINSASFYFSFSDDSDAMWGYFQSLGTSYSPYTLSSTVYNASDDYFYYYNIRSVTDNAAFQMFGEAEQVSLSLGRQFVGSGATTLSTSTSQATSYQYQLLDKSNTVPRYVYVYVCGDYNICSVSGSTEYYYPTTTPPRPPSAQTTPATS